MKLKWLAVAPAIGLLFGTPLLNKISYSLFGLPIILVWEVLCTIATSLILLLIYKREQKIPVREEAEKKDTEGNSV